MGTKQMTLTPNISFVNSLHENYTHASISACCSKCVLICSFRAHDTSQLHLFIAEKAVIAAYR